MALVPSLAFSAPQPQFRRESIEAMKPVLTNRSIFEKRGMTSVRELHPG
jgi:hypothetical protein